MQITYDKMLEMCKEAYPSLIWGGEKDGDVCYSSVSLIDEHLTFHLKDTTALDDCIDKIWNEKNNSAYLWSRKTVQDYIEQVMRYLRARESYTDILISRTVIHTATLLSDKDSRSSAACLSTLSSTVCVFRLRPHEVTSSHLQPPVGWCSSANRLHGAYS